MIKALTMERLFFFFTLLFSSRVDHEDEPETLRVPFELSIRRYVLNQVILNY